MISYFTFGQVHLHRLNGFTYDCDVVVSIEVEDPFEARKIMVSRFDRKWAFQYDNTPPDMSFFPRGIKELPQ